MIWKFVQRFAGNLALLALLIASFWWFSTFLPRAPLQVRAWWMTVATAVLGAVFAGAWNRASSANRSRIIVPSIGVAGWIVLLISARSVRIGADVEEFFLFILPFLALCYWVPKGANGDRGGARPHYQAKRGQLVVLAACSIMVFLACHETMPWNVSVFVLALAIVQSVGAAFPDQVASEPKADALPANL